MLTRVLVVNDHAVVRRGVFMHLDTEPAMHVVREAEDSQDAAYKANWLKPDVILLDLVMPNRDGINAITELKSRFPNTKIIVLTSFDNEEKIAAVMKAGADGFMIKDDDNEALLNAIQTVQTGGMPLHPAITDYLLKNVIQSKSVEKRSRLTGREKEVLLLVAKGLTNKSIAETLTISEGTVKVHLSNILSKLNASSRTEAAFSATQLGLISLSSNNEQSREDI